MCRFLEIITLCKGTPEKYLLAFVSLAATTSPRSWTREYRGRCARSGESTPGKRELSVGKTGGDAVT